MHSKILSPLTKIKEGRIKLIHAFDSKRIIKDYRNIDIDVQRFFDKEETYLYKCNVTGYRFYYPFSTIGDAKFYEDLSRNRSDYYSERWEHRTTMNYIDAKDSLLEIGSGFGAFLKLLESHHIKAKGLELNPHAVQKCKEEGLDV